MAIQANITLDSGLSAATAYIRVMDLVIKKDPDSGNTKLNFGIETHATKAKRDALAPAVLATRYKISYDSTKEAYAQAYAHLKTLYPGSTDV